MGKEKQNIPTTWGLDSAILALAVIALCAPLYLNEPLPRGSDCFSTAHYLQGFMKAFGEGDYYPRWTDPSNMGLGAPSFVMFPPMAFYGAGLSTWIAGSVVGGFKLYFLLVALLSAISFYVMARHWIGQGPPAAAGAALYLLLPYHVLDMYQRFALSETTAFIFFPLIILFARRLLTVGRRSDFVCLSLSYAGLIYTHLVSAFIFSLLLGAWVLWESRRDWKALPVLAGALACGIFLAAPALIPAAVEKSNVNIAWQREMFNGDFRMNFIFRDDVIPGLGFRDPVKPPVLKAAHSQLLLGIVAAVLALAATTRQNVERRRAITIFTVALGISYFLQIRLSTPLWLIIPELPTVQFPWRFQTISVLAAAQLAGFALSDSSRKHLAWDHVPGVLRKPAVLVILALIAVNLYLAGKNAYLKPYDFDEARISSPAVIGWSEPSLTPVQFKQYRQFKKMRITVPRLSWTSGRGEVEIPVWESSSRSIDVKGSSGGTMTLAAFWFPGWTGTIDSGPLKLGPDDQGFISFDVPPGDHRIRLRFLNTGIRSAAQWLGIAGLFLMPLSGMGLLRWREGKQRPAADP